MEIVKILSITVLSITAICIIIFALRAGRPLKTLLLSAAAGLTALVVINLTTFLTGVHIPVNEWTVAGGCIFGIPALCGMIILQIIF